MIVLIGHHNKPTDSIPGCRLKATLNKYLFLNLLFCVQGYVQFGGFTRSHRLAK